MLAELKQSFIHLFYPHTCAGCGTDALPQHTAICLHCLHHLPGTGFALLQDNPVERAFAGRLPLAHGMSLYYFNKSGALQHILHELKYKGNKKAGTQLGSLLGHALAESRFYSGIDAIIPLPLFAGRQKERGYNQSEIISSAAAEILQKPVVTNAAARLQKTTSQTKKNRLQRWQNMQGRFTLQQTEGLHGKHLLLVDDVMTTGATLESCGNELLQIPCTTLSIATIAYASTI